jgi:hypothetical protein
MITQKDLTQLVATLSKVFVTREELYQNFATKDEFTEGMKVVRNDILNFKDEILTEIVAMRQELSVVIGYRDKIEDQDQRLETIETTLKTKSKVLT